MARLSEHFNCPNPVRWGCSPIKTVYIRDVQDGKTVWKPVGLICTGCGVFRSKMGWFPSGIAGPICEPWQPSKYGDEPPELIEPEPVPEVEAEVGEFTHTLEAHIDYGGPGKTLEDPGDRSRVTIARLQRALGLSRAEVVAKVQAGEIPVEKDQYRHWSVPYGWLEGARNAKV